MRRTTITLFSFTLFFALGSCDSFDNSEDVKYYVSNTTERVAVTYTKSDGQMSETKTVRTPWSTKISTTYGGDIFLTVQFIEGEYSEGDNATARILSNGSECASGRKQPPGFQLGCTSSEE
jgi:hypothetical protein